MRFVAILTFVSCTMSAEQIRCPNGEVHEKIDLRTIAIEYKGSAFSGTISSIQALGIHLSAVPKILQTAATATQQWNEFLKGLVAGFNTCAVTNAQYNEGLKRIYPKLVADAAELEPMRQMLSDGRKIDEQRLQAILDRFLANFRQFARAVQGEELLLRIERLFAEGKIEIIGEVRSGNERTQQGIDQILRMLETLKKPAEVKAELSAMKKTLLAKADAAEGAYNEGYASVERGDFRRAAIFLMRR